jgi:hypothetical protein
MDSDDYPTEEELERIRQWPYEDCGGLLQFIGSTCWAYPERGFEQKGRRFRLATSGWSGNEEVISALQDNRMFWAICWESSHRGGLYIFEVPKINMGNAQPVRARDKASILNDCARCGEDATLVSSDGLHMARVRRTSKCKDKKKRGEICQTEICPVRQDAIDEWNRTFGKPPA